MTGATGNIGRCVVERLVGAGQPVRAMTRNPAAARLPAGVEVVTGDFTRPDSWADALRGVDRLYLFPFAGPGFVERAAEAGVRRFVTHSAAAAGFTPRDPADGPLAWHLEDERTAHRAVEAAVEATGAEWTHVRPGILAAGALGWAESVRTEGVVREPHGESGYPLVHEADVAEVAVAALLTGEHAGAAYTITGPEKVTRREQVAAIAEATGRDVEFVELTEQQARELWAAQGYPDDVTEWLLALSADAIDGTGVLPPTGTFETITGRPPRTFRRWAADHAAEFTGVAP
ncbi:NAD-dependent epimerase/dehydratase family protein [Amycolatopsis suaedae]|uniref:NAD-dependent epimerase/dehydratase family protein n=1 Tax=Amycolatopsis suaedae TaxID=2510978 RepID=A0A4Q7J7J2_9PSEU|nr:NAD-dependent epimerase/dehydratase family protein [Amycolatopsis suaedae]